MLARYHAVEGWPGTSATQKELWHLAESHTPEIRCADYTQAIMDLGAKLCTRRNPDCPACPLKKDCQARLRGEVDRYPTPKPAKTLPLRTCYFLILTDTDGRVLLQQRPPSGLWGGLWCFPQCPDKKSIGPTCHSLGVVESTDPVAARDLDGSRHFAPKQRHTFSHYQLDYTPVFIETGTKGPRHLGAIAENHLAWVFPHAPGELGLPKPVQHLLNSLVADTGAGCGIESVSVSASI